MDEQGKILRGKRSKGSPTADERAAMEASYCWQSAYELLEEMGHEVKLAHPMKTRIIAGAKIKTDTKDSEALAHLSELVPSNFPRSSQRNEGTQGARELRTYLVRERAMFKSRIRAELAKGKSGF